MLAAALQAADTGDLRSGTLRLLAVWLRLCCPTSCQAGCSFHPAQPWWWTKVLPWRTSSATLAARKLLPPLLRRRLRTTSSSPRCAASASLTLSGVLALVCDKGYLPLCLQVLP